MFCDTDHMRRIVSFPNGLWQAQIKVAEKGTDVKDCWVGYHAPTTREKAMEQMTFRDISETSHHEIG